MKFKHFALALGAFSLAASPALAQVALDRSAAPVEGESELEGGGTTTLFLVLGAAAVVGGIIAATGGGDDNPTSP